ncbi:MAG TPA: Hsp20/alpha crystallin family protein [Candidatus Paceibacterota bacterium]
MKKGSFFERLTGSHYYDEEVPEASSKQVVRKIKPIETDVEAPLAGSESETEAEGQLTVDVFQTPNEIVIEAMIPAVKADDLDISITREMVIIKGSRTRSKVLEDDQFFFRELFWGSFSRTILLPQEVEPDEADAREKNGLLTIVLPKSDRNKHHKVKVKSNSN